MLAAAGGEKQGKARHNSAGMLSPRILVIQATPDRPSDYNAMMNCAFACSSHHEDQQESKAHHHESMEDANRIVVDGCFLPSIINGRASRSLVLEQVCDRTGGVFLAPSGAAQVGGGLTQVLCTVFLPPRSVRRHLHLPVLTEVDFRARCFATGESVEMAHVCNQCLSIFRDRPTDSICPTCGASGASLVVADSKEASLSDEQRSAKRQKHS
jgi:transcription initiation factor TFIIH subunit 3